jgi:DNA-binding response OmpR family regulator
LVEDEGFVREVTCEVLRSAGYRVITAENAIEAEREYVQFCEEVDLLLTDVILPGENGRSLAGRLKVSHPELHILLVTGYTEQIGLGEEGREECLAKPFSARELLQRVKQTIRRGEFECGQNQRPDEIRPVCGNA